MLDPIHVNVLGLKDKNRVNAKSKVTTAERQSDEKIYTT